MRNLASFVVLLAAIALVGCGGGSSSIISAPPQAGTAPVSISLHDMPPSGVSVLSFQATLTGISMEPGSVSLLNTPMTLEMTQLQGVSAYMGTVAVPVGNYTGMTITLANPKMTFLNNTVSTMGGMMGGGTCANGQICQLAPSMMSSSVTISSSPFPITVRENTPFNMDMDFDLMNSLQSNMVMNPVMTSTMQQTTPASNMFDEMDDMIGQIGSVDAANNQLKISFAQGMSSMTVAVDSNTTFEDFDRVGKPNTISGLAQGQIVMVKIQLMAGGTLHASKVRFESDKSQVMDGMIVAINSPTQIDVLMTNGAPAFQGVNIGDVVRMNLQAGTMFDIDDTDIPVTGMSFASASDFMVGQMVQIEPTSALVPGTPGQLNTNHIRLMRSWITSNVGSKMNATTFSLNNLPGLFGSASFSAMSITTSTQTSFDNVIDMSALNVGDMVSVRGPLFLVNGTPTMIASKVQKR